MDKKFFGALMAALLVLMVVPVKAVSVGSGVGIEMDTEDFKPLIWMCDSRVVYDDNVEPGRISEGGDELVERINNYAFTGEQIEWKVLVMDKNGIDKIKDVYVAVGAQGSDDSIEADCEIEFGSKIDESCNARIGEEKLKKFDADTMRYYKCTFTVEPDMDGEYWVHATVVDSSDQFTTVDEDEYWFLNPEIQLKITGGINFGTVRPGTIAYSPTLLVGNDAEAGSGVLLDMFISGTDFYDPGPSGAKCPTTNQLALENFAYYAVNGAYSTQADIRSDVEGYVGINYGDHFESNFYYKNEIIQALNMGGYYLANVLAPGSEMSITFRLSLPEPCNGDFTSGSIFFWGEAI